MTAYVADEGRRACRRSTSTRAAFAGPPRPKRAWAPAVGDGRVFLAVAGGVRALDAATGATVWERSLPAAAAAPPHWDNGWLVRVGRGRRSGRPCAPPTASRSGRSPLGAVVATAPVPALDALYLGLTDGRIIAARAHDRPRAMDADPRRPRHRPSRARRTARGRHDGTGASTAWISRTGTSRWRWRVGGPAVGRATADERRIYFAAYDHLLRAVDRRSGNLRWRRALPHRPAGSPLVAGALVLMPSLSPEISAYDAAHRAPRRSPSPAPARSRARPWCAVGGSAAGTPTPGDLGRGPGARVCAPGRARADQARGAAGHGGDRAGAGSGRPASLRRRAATAGRSARRRPARSGRDTGRRSCGRPTPPPGAATRPARRTARTR